jgi:hypothetical protein
MEGRLDGGAIVEMRSFSPVAAIDEKATGLSCPHRQTGLLSPGG